MQPGALEKQAAFALSRGDPLTALNLLPPGGGPHGRALRGIALAQLQEFGAAEQELRSAASDLADQPLYRARALAALAEIAAARREVGTALDDLADAARDLRAAGDRRNAAWAHLVRVRLLLLIGATEEAHRELDEAVETKTDDPVLEAALELARAHSSARVLSAEGTLNALDRALAILAREDHPLLAAELEAHRRALGEPLARVRMGSAPQGKETRAANLHVDVALPELASLFRGAELPAGLTIPAGTKRWVVVDAIARRVAFAGDDGVDLSRREVLFRCLEHLAQAWPESVTSGSLVRSVFDGPGGLDECSPAERDEHLESYRDRVRVEVGRLRKLLPPSVSIEALGNNWRLRVPEASVVVHVALLRNASPITALLADGSPWAARDLAFALGASERSIQRALNDLAETGTAAPQGRARARRWVLADGEGEAAAFRQSPSGIASQMFLVSLLVPREAAPDGSTSEPEAEPDHRPEGANRRETQS